MNIRRAQRTDLDAICDITDQAKLSIAAMGFDQWQQGYPNREIWKQDIDEGLAYVAVDRGEVVGMFRYSVDPEAAYEAIEGRWLTEDPYASIHRCAVNQECRGQGIINALFEYACKMAAADGMRSVRIDTHPDNSPMKRALEKAGFELCGTVVLVDGVEAGGTRVAFEKLL